MKSLTIPLGALVLVAGLSLSTLPAASQPAAAPPQSDALEVYVVEGPTANLGQLGELGIDTQHVMQESAGAGKVRLELIVTGRQAAKVRDAGFQAKVKQVDGKKASQAARAQQRAGYSVYRSWSEDGGIADELRATAAANPRIAKLVRIGRTVQGKEILALKVTKNARNMRDGSRKAVLYGGAQHAREWITPEMVRRLMHHFLDGYGTDAQITRLVNTTELWFLPVSNPDGYDLTFTEGNRLWRKNVRDNNGDGAITPGDGVDPNRNFKTKWGWDNEGSSPDPTSETYRGPSAGSEPETKALDSLFRKVGFEFYINYHSAAELLLYGIGWQVSTPSPDDVINVAMAGDDAEPAVPGYDPDISAELYTTNGDTDTHATVKYGTLGFTPEMTTCETVSDSVPDDEWVSEDCVSGFNFPDDEELIQAEFEKNIPFALATAASAQDPDDPVSVVGRDTPALVADPFSVSHGRTQPVAVTAKRALKDLRLRYRINRGRTQSVKVREWRGGERYGDTHDDYYAEFRGKVERTRPGDSVEVWFTGTEPRSRHHGSRGRHGGGKGTSVSSTPFTYRVANDIGGDVLILAAEDVTGISPVQGVASAKYADEYAAALTAAGYSSDVYDVDVNGRVAPHHLGVLSHYDAIVWESGDDIITRAVEQPGGTAAKLANDLELTVRDYLNEGGKALVTGQYNQYGQATAASYFFSPTAPPECTVRAEPCLTLENDFQQYWLGAYNYVSDGATGEDGPYGVRGEDGGPFAGFASALNGGDSPDNQEHTASLLSTSSFLPPDEFPQFRSSAPLKWDRPGAAPFDPVDGDWYAFSQVADQGWKRLARTVDLTGATSGALQFQVSYDTETDWDFLVVEAREVGTENWTTLPETNGHTTQSTGAACPEGWVDIHPQVAHYQGADCSPTGSTGEWNAATGSSNGWQDWNLDLTPFAGKQVEVSISYISDWVTQGLGVFVDDAHVIVDGAETTATSFETDLGGWTTPPAPEGSRQTNTWERSQRAFEEGSATLTKDTVFTGFGAEGLQTAAQRAEFVERVMAHLLD
ncbi:immune inhibitor A [Aeromicrobium senzhongii]|uniref:Immune inhibitor A n=1 Tax=Aeromicrobium senzhongii TaxID=2663859 RepID=A0ABX6SZ41_9ACTN|nr:M14 family metallopeptidase [Aeromicrobium senzhongii]MTB87217.1 zinc carboxypeptidase [Aeromicrobium senzhongii]QNL95709.1 immune inhibitor A [Aeromicrobium senzhongii]